ncbi:hypothetical protein Tco_0793644 [Tanacetum coccineum]
MVNTLESEIAKLTSLVAQLSQSLQARKKELDDDESLGKGIRRNDGNNDGKNDARKVFDELSSIKIGTVREQYDAFVPIARQLGWSGVSAISMFLWRLQPVIRRKGIEIVSTKEENDVHQDSSVSDVSVVNKADKMEQKGEVGNGMIDISIGLMGIRVMNCDDKGVEDICEENVEGVGMELDATSCLGNIDKLCTKAGKGNELGSNESSDVEVNGVIMKDSTDQTEFQSALLLNDHKTNWRGQDSSWSSKRKVPKLKLTGSAYVSHPKLTDTILKDEDMESIGVISNNFKGIWEDSEKMIILLIHMVSGVKWGLSDSKEKGLSNLKCFIQSKGVTRSISDFDGKYLFMSCKDANKNGVNICYWELSGCKWRAVKKGHVWSVLQFRNNKWKFDTWRWPKKKKVVIGLFSGKDGYGFAFLANKNVNSLYPLIMVVKSAEDSVLDSVWEETKVMDNVIKCFGKDIVVNKNQMVFKLLLEFASNIHRVHDINDTRLREIDAKFGDLGLEKRLKLVKKTYLGRDRRAHLLHFSLENLISDVQKPLVDSWVFGCIVWIRIIEVQFDVPKDEVQFEPKVQLEPEVQPEPKCGPEPEHEVELMVINKELLNYPSSRPVLSIKLPELRNKLEDKHCLKKEGLIRAQLEVNTAA